jgi:DNA-binding XRE family transcriptional regulator
MDYYKNVHKYWTERREILMATTLNISQRVKDARCDADLTQTELGRKIGKSKQWVSELERGNIRLSYEMAVVISKVCNKSTDFFCT